MRSLKGSIRKFAIGITPINDIHMADYDFSCIFYVNNNSRAIELSKADMKQINQDSYMAIVDTSKLATGKIHCRIEAYIPDDDIEGGRRLEIYDVEESQATASASCLNITLWDLVKYPNVTMESLCGTKPVDLETLNGDETVLVTLPDKTKGSISIEKLAKSIGGGAPSESPYFKTFATEADYLAVKDNLETDCIIYIEDKDNVIYHGVLKANFIYEVNEDYEDFCLTNLGIPANSIANAMLGMAENSVILTIASPLFSSFVVDGQEMITGDEYFDFTATDESEAFKNACIIMPYELGKTYEVQAVFKSTDEIMGLVPDSAYINVMTRLLFGFTPLTKLTIDDNYVFVMSLTDADTISGHFFSLVGAYMLNELTYNVEANPYINLDTSYVEYLIMSLRVGASGSDIQPYYKERILNVNNDSSWGEPYVSGELDDSRVNDFLYMMSIPGELLEESNPINYTINII